jgi:peptidoglycan/xylan/chitin deacetylase (PgdA/CDA1 family)
MSLHRCRLGSSVDRRDFLALLAAGIVGVIAGCSSVKRRPRAAPSAVSSPPPTIGLNPTTTTTTTTLPPTLPPIPPPHPGRPEIFYKGPQPSSQIALTIDDGYCSECVTGYVDFSERTGIHITFSPNGVFGDLWKPHADRLRPLIAAGQVQIANHTWAHPDLVRLGSSTIRTQIERNEEWIEQTFGITARPWFRPPYGSHNAEVDGIAASLGYTNILLWNGTLGDATVESAAELMGLARQWVQAGAIVLGHANHPTVLGLFDQLQQLIADRHLQPVTLDGMFGTSRSLG